MDAKIPYGDYEDWLLGRHEIELTDDVYDRYDLVLDEMHRAVAQSPFWEAANCALSNLEDTYRRTMDSRLLVDGFLRGKGMSLKEKGFESFLQKTYRRNILDNKGFDLSGEPQKEEAPEGGWLLPTDCHDRFWDLLRTTLVVRYGDGMGRVVECLDQTARALGADVKCSAQARPYGYYAHHFYLFVPIQLESELRMGVEIQVHTQLQEVLAELTHKEYEAWRMTPGQRGEDWQWDYGSPEFSLHNLGHVLQFLEGPIMTARRLKG